MDPKEAELVFRPPIDGVECALLTIRVRSIGRGMLVPGMRLCGWGDGGEERAVDWCAVAGCAVDGCAVDGCVLFECLVDWCVLFECAADECVLFECAVFE